jgi:predicted transcriptional regulator
MPDIPSPADDAPAADTVDGVLRGLEDMRAGRIVPHAEAMDEIDAVIEKIAREAA